MPCCHCPACATPASRSSFPRPALRAWMPCCLCDPCVALPSSPSSITTLSFLPLRALPFLLSSVTPTDKTGKCLSTPHTTSHVMLISLSTAHHMHISSHNTNPVAQPHTDLMFSIATVDSTLPSSLLSLFWQSVR
jgi:hypothetical protein